MFVGSGCARGSDNTQFRQEEGPILTQITSNVNMEIFQPVSQLKVYCVKGGEEVQDIEQTSVADIVSLNANSSAVLLAQEAEKKAALRQAAKEGQIKRFEQEIRERARQIEKENRLKQELEERKQLQAKMRLKLINVDVRLQNEEKVRTQVQQLHGRSLIGSASSATVIVSSRKQKASGKGAPSQENLVQSPLPEQSKTLNIVPEVHAARPFVAAPKPTLKNAGSNKKVQPVQDAEALLILPGSDSTASRSVVKVANLVAESRHAANAQLIPERKDFEDEDEFDDVYEDQYSGGDAYTHCQNEQSSLSKLQSLRERLSTFSNK